MEKEISIDIVDSHRESDATHMLGALLDSGRSQLGLLVAPVLPNLPRELTLAKQIEDRQMPQFEKHVPIAALGAE